MQQPLYISRPCTLVLHLARTRFLQTREQSSTPLVEWLRKWTKDNDGITLRRRREGAQFSSIANELGRTTASVHARYPGRLDSDPPSQEHIFTPRDDDIIIQRKCEGVENRTIAEELQCPVGKMESHWRKLKFRSDVPDAVFARAIRPRSKLGHLNRREAEALIDQRCREGKTYKAIAKEVQCSISTVRHWYRLIGSSRDDRYSMDSRPFSDLEKRTALRLKSEGWKHLAIATELGRTSAGLAGFFRRQRVADGRPPTRIVRPYTEDEDQILLELRKDGQTYREIGTLLGRDIGSLYSRHKLLSEPPPKTSSRWTAKEVDELIRQHDQGVGIKDIAAALGRRALSVKDKLLGTLARRGRTDVPLDYGTRNKRQGPHH